MLIYRLKVLIPAWIGATRFKQGTKMTNEIKNYYKTVRKITKGTYNKAVGMYIGEQNDPTCKQNHNILETMVPTSNLNDTITIQRGFYQRNYLKHKKGDPKTVKVLRKVPAPTTPNIQAAWQIVFDYPTVSYGLSFFRRDAIIIDSDAYYKSLENAKEIISDFTKKAQLPEVSYILRNPTSGHIQCGWFLDEPFEKYEFGQYNEANKMFASMYQAATGNDGDICFHGPACKNPFYEGFESYVSFNVASKQLLLEKSNSWLVYLSRKSNETSNYNNNNSSLSPLYNITKVTVKDKVTTMSKAGRNKVTKSTFGSEETSRDAIECRKLREWVWSEMRRGTTPTYFDARQMMDVFAIEAAKMTNKPVHSDAELTATTKCTYTWAKTHFNRTTTSTGDRAGAAWGRLVHKMQSFVIYAEVLKYKAEHPTASTREIGNAVGLSNKQVSVMLNADVNAKLSEVKQFMQYVNQFPKYASQYSVLVSSLISAKKDVLLYNNNSFSSLYYNNTKVTVENNTEVTTKNNNKKTETTTDKQAEDTFDLTKHCATEEKRYQTWEEFCQSKDVWNTLRHRPRLKDWLDYKHNKLTIREAA